MSINEAGPINSRPNLYNYLNEAIIKPTQFLIKQEAHFLSLDNKELRRNNEDLAERIEQMFLEFGLGPLSKTPLTDNSTTTKIGRQSQAKTKTTEKQNHDTHDGSINRGTSQSDLPTSHDRKTMKIGEAKNENLKNIENPDNLSHNGSKLSKKNKRGIDEDPQSRSQIGTKTLSDSISPVYLDVFDNPDKAAKFFRGKSDQPSHYTITELNKSGHLHDGGHDFSSHTYAAIQKSKFENKLKDNNKSPKEMKDPYFNLSGEEFRKLQNHEEAKEPKSTKHPNIAVDQLEKSNSLGSSSVDLTNLTKSQKKIIDMLAKNSDVLASLQRQDSPSPRNKSHGDIETSFDNHNSKPSKSESSQTTVKLPINSGTSSINQNSYSHESTDRKFKNTGKKDFKTDSLADIFPMVLTKSDEIKVEFNENKSKVNSFDRSKDTPFSNAKKLNKNPNSLGSNINDPLFPRSESNNSYESLFPLPVIPETVPEFIYENLDSENSSSDNNKFGGNRTGKEIDIVKSENVTQVFANPVGMSFDENLAISNTSLPQLKMSPRVLHQMVDDSVLTYRTSTDNEERSYSNDLESSYETLYDPVLTSRYQASDDNMFYL